MAKLKKYICNRCGKTMIKPYLRLLKQQYGYERMTMTGNIYTRNEFRYIGFIDLCQKCTTKFEQWTTKKRNQVNH